MKIFFSGIVLFFIAAPIHFIIWKIRFLASKKFKTLKIFSLVYLAWLIVSIAQLFYNIEIFNAPLTISQIIHVSLFFFSISFIYMVTINAIEVDSITVNIIMTIYRAGNAGIEKQKVLSLNILNNFFESRMNHLILEKMVEVKNNKYRITFKGSLLMHLIVFHRKYIIGIKEIG